MVGKKKGTAEQINPTAVASSNKRRNKQQKLGTDSGPKCTLLATHLRPNLAYRALEVNNAFCLTAVDTSFPRFQISCIACHKYYKISL